jgi:hypothetical protein
MAGRLDVDLGAAMVACSQLTASVEASQAATAQFRAASVAANAGGSPVAQLVTTAAQTGAQFADAVDSTDAQLNSNITSTESHIKSVGITDVENAAAVPQT